MSICALFGMPLRLNFYRNLFMTIFIIESIVACILFTAFILLLVLRKPENCINSWPPAVKQRIIAEKLLDVTDARMTKVEIIRKVAGSLIFVVVIGLVLRYVNKITKFIPAVLTSYGIWAVVDWWDAFVIDVIACKWKKMRIKGTEDWDKEYDNLKFHIKESWFGMALGIPFAFLVGLFVIIIS